MARPRRTVVLTLLPDEWDRLVAAGRAEERDPWQHARWLLLRGLDAAAEPAGSDEQPAPTADVA